MRGKNPQVLTGPAPSQKTLSTQGETDARDKTGKSPHSHAVMDNENSICEWLDGTLGQSWTQDGNYLSEVIVMLY